MASTFSAPSSIPAAATVAVAARRLHHYPQLSNASLSLGQSLNAGEASTLNESLSSSSMSPSTLVTIIFSTASSQENQQLLLNSYASCRRLLSHMKQAVGINQDEMIDLMDSEGKLKELNTHFDDYATQFLTPRNTYYVLKVEIDSATGEKRYTPSFNLDQVDQKLCSILTNSLNTLNKSVSKSKRTTAVRQTTVNQPSSNAPQTRVKRAPSRKQNQA